MVTAAGRHSCGSADALSKLCATYWLPVYAFIRRKGYSPEESEDLCQSFFTRVLEHGTLGEARRERGKFRSFLLASATHFVANEWDRSRAQKGGALDRSFARGDAELAGDGCGQLRRGRRGIGGGLLLQEARHRRRQRVPALGARVPCQNSHTVSELAFSATARRLSGTR